ncbi:uncharacterized protein [Hoplias malabaricus]|uniref:uncharacterized protein isoform X2 n=1 Tax=Hoplias malabaricus TaxID=27720 RepID=UPI0034631B32
MELRRQKQGYLSMLNRELAILMAEAESAFISGFPYFSDFPDLKTYAEGQSCLKAGGCYGTYQLLNTCVLDSLLVAILVCYRKYLIIQDLFNSDHILRSTMSFLYMGRPEEAKVFCLIQLNLLSDNCKFFMSGEVDVTSMVDDYLPLFNNLACARYFFDEDRSSPRVSDEIYQNILSAFVNYGDVKLLGTNYIDPVFIIVNIDGRLDRAPELLIQQYGRTFMLQFMLLCNKIEAPQHMLSCNKEDDGWILCDIRPGGPHITDFDIEKADFKNQYVIYSAGYIKTEEKEDEVPFGVPEDGSSAFGARPFNLPLEMSSSTRTVKPKND